DKFFSKVDSRTASVWLSTEDKKNWQAQRKLLEAELKILRKIDPAEKSTEFGKVYRRLGVAEMVLSGLEGSKKADTYFDKALKALKDGPKDQLALVSMEKAKNLSFMPGNQEAAQKALEDALKFAENSPLKGKREHGLILSDLGLVMFRKGKLAEAEKYFSGAASIFRTHTTGKDDKDFQSALRHLSWAKQYQGKDGTKELDEYIKRF